MRVPENPPRSSFQLLVEQYDTKTLVELLADAKPIDSKNRYQSWEEFRRRPTPNEMSAEEAWAFVRMARRTRSVDTGLSSMTGDPFTITEVGPLRNMLHRIDSTASGHLTSFAPVASVDEANRHFVTSLIEEPFSSSVFEGAVTTRERAKAMIEAGSAPQSRDDRMVLNNYLAMRFVKEHAEEVLTPQLLLDVHRIVTEGTLEKPDAAGRLRRADEDVAVVDDLTGERVHEPPPADALPSRLQRLCDFANEDYREADPFLNPVTRAILLHFMIGYDHPFWDGNGRTARALFYWYVLKHGYWLLEYVSISKIIREETGLIYERAYLNTETDDGDATYFILHQLGVIIRALEALKVYLAEKAAEADTVSAAVQRMERGGNINHRQAGVLIDAAKHPDRRLTIAGHQKLSGVTYLTARKDLDRLHEAGWLTRKRVGRQIEYRPTDTLADLIERT